MQLTMWGFLGGPQGPYIITLHGSLILLRGLTHPDPPLISHTGRRGHYVSRRSRWHRPEGRRLSAKNQRSPATADEQGQSIVK